MIIEKIKITFKQVAYSSSSSSPNVDFASDIRSFILSTLERLVRMGFFGFDQSQKSLKVNTK